MLTVYALTFFATGFLTACERTEQALIEEPETPQQQSENLPKAPDKTEKILHIEANTQERSQKMSKIDPAPKALVTKTKATEINPQPAARTQPNVKITKAEPFRVRRCMNMGNALEAPYEGDWGYRITAQDLRTVANAGFDTVRIPIRWDAHTAHSAPYTIDAQFMARVKTVVRNAQSSGLSVIIDVHHYEDLMARPTREQSRFLSIWDQIALNFANAPDTVYFEVLNEPTLQLSGIQLNALYAKVIPIIRTTNPTRKIILGGNSWNSVEALSDVRWSLDSNLVATFHDYGPHEFTHQGAEWSDPVWPLGRHWGRASDMAEMQGTYRLAKNFKAKTGLPVFVGEFGVIDKVPVNQRFEWTKARRKAMEAHGFSWCAWDFAGAFKSYDTKTRRWLPGAQDAFFGR